MTQHYDRTTITEVPVPEKVVIIHSRYKSKPAYRDTLREPLITGSTHLQALNDLKNRYSIIDADQDQLDQLTTRLSLRREK